MIVAGIDEAGYGPLLGPLVVSATALEIAPPADAPSPPTPQAPTDVKALPDFWKLLRPAVAKKAPATKGKMFIADSKAVHALTDGLKQLERGVLAFAHAAGTCPNSAENQPLTASQLVHALDCSPQPLAQHPWYAAHDRPLPWLCEPGDLAIAANMLRGALTHADVKIARLCTRVVPEREFNTLWEGTQNKASVLVSITLTHLYNLHQSFGHAPGGLVVGIDKQGGRDFYTQPLLRTFPDAHLKVVLESPKASTYVLTEGPRRTVVHFREKGETHFLPTALASMICKYLRETFMHTFNHWWCQRIDGLKPTAGYHGDGSRWLADVEPHLTRLAVEKHHLVRIR